VLALFFSSRSLLIKAVLYTVPLLPFAISAPTLYFSGYHVCQLTSAESNRLLRGLHKDEEYEGGCFKEVKNRRKFIRFGCTSIIVIPMEPLE
jgi:hypothetical protein